MKIEKLIIKNFRCFGPEPITVDFENEVTALVGGNGSGKTALFFALSRLFGVTSSQRSVQRRDFHIDPSIGKIESGATLFIESILGFPELDTVDEDNNTDPVPEFFNHMAASGPGEPIKVRIRLQATWIDDGTPEGTIEEDIRWIHTLEDNFDWESCSKVAPIERATIQLVYLPAVRNAADCVTTLLKGRLWKAAKWSSKLLRSAQRSAALIQKRFEQEEPAKFIIERLTSRWRQLYRADTDTTPILRTFENQLEELVGQVNFVFHPDESGKDHRLAELSDGQRSLFHIALTATLLESERDVLKLASRKSPFDQQKLRRTYLTIVAIEEPENSLSPFFLSRIMNQAREIGRLDSAQVILSSHSASILSRIEPEEVRYFRHDYKNSKTFVCRLSLPEDKTEARQYVRLAVRAYPELYFARFVILGEGDSERVVLPRLAEAMNVPLDPSFVPIVPLAGRYVKHFWRLLNDLQIPSATLLDLDLGRVHGGANIIRQVVEALNEIGNDLSQNPYVVTGKADLNQLSYLKDSMLKDGFVNNIWLKMLKKEGIFFSYPLDLDFAMLAAFPKAYQHPHTGGRGPQSGPEDIMKKREITLKTGGNPDIYEKYWDPTFVWYPYLFLNRSKPESHFIALNRIKDESLIAEAPVELRELISHTKQILYTEEGNM